MRVYLAGPMRGLPGWNRETFDHVEIRWREAGCQVFSPSRLDRTLGYVSSEGEGTRDLLQHVMSIDVACIYAAEAIALLPGWEESRGVAVELALALFLNLPVYDAVTMQRMVVRDRPWGRKQDGGVTSSQKGYPTPSPSEEIQEVSPPTGVDPANKVCACVRCNGSGYRSGVTLVCGSCDGTGKDPKVVCNTCAGTGYEPGGCHGAPCSECG